MFKFKIISLLFLPSLLFLTQAHAEKTVKISKILDTNLFQTFDSTIFSFLMCKHSYWTRERKLLDFKRLIALQCIPDGKACAPTFASFARR